VPGALPPELGYERGLVMALSRADAALGELSGLGREVADPRLLIEPAVRREAVLSSRIEGTMTSLEELLAEEIGAPGRREEAQMREVRNYIAALEHGRARLPRTGLSLQLVRELHVVLMDGVRGGLSAPGAFRTTQNRVGPPGCTPATATYVPPPPQAMLRALDGWESFVQRGAACPDLIQCALQHVQFESIHPFIDGNGRVGRLLVTLFLLQRGRLSQPLLSLSAFIEARRQEYYRLLQLVRTHGAWDDWLLFFLEGVEESARGALARARQLLDLRDTLRLQVAHAAPKALPLVDALITNPYLTANRAAEVLRTSLPTARAQVERLARAGLLTESTGRAWGRIYTADSVLDALRGEG